MSSSDSVKDITSLLDSSVTECKKDINMNASASPMDRLDEEACRSGAEEQVQSRNRMQSSTGMKKETLNNTRYFIIKSLNYQNIQMSIKEGIWATQVVNEPILEEAFQNSGKVILIFSVNMSGFFQGYAQMMSSVGWRRDNIWSQGCGKNSWGRSFKVKWLCLHDLPFQKTLHLRNPWNDFKPVKISRDCQELPRDLGEALCELLDAGDDMGVNFRRDGVSKENFHNGRSCVDPFVSRQDEDFNVPPVQMGPLSYPPVFYQHQTEANPFFSPHQQASSALNSSSFAPGASKLKQSKHCRINGKSATRMDNSSQFDGWGLPERDPFDCALTEDDILEMTYEEYLEAHARFGRRSNHSAVGRSMSLQKSSSSKERSDESQSASSSKKRTYHQSFD